MRIAHLVLIIALVAACGGAATRTLPNGSTIGVVDQACADRLKPIYDAATALDSRLGVGLNKNDYSSRLGDIKVAHDAAVRGGPFESGPCFETVQKLETVMSEYTTANALWTTCITTVSCDFQTQTLPTVQTHWATASTLLNEVAIALP